MSDRTQDVQKDMHDTRQRMSDTIGEIERRISEAATSVRQRVDVLQMARSNPWAAVGLALGAGFAIGRSAADRRAARVVVAGAAAAGTAIADGAVAAKDAVVGLVRRGDDGSQATASNAMSQTDGSAGGIRGQIDGAIEGLLAEGLTEVMASLRRGARSSPSTASGFSASPIPAPPV